MGDQTGSRAERRTSVGCLWTGGDGDSFREADSLAGDAGRPFGATSEHPKHGLFPNEVLVDAFYHIYIYIYINKSCYGF